MKELKGFGEQSFEIGFRGFVVFIKERTLKPLLSTRQSSHYRTAVFGFILCDAVSIRTEWLKRTDDKERAVAHFVPTLKNNDKALTALGYWFDNIFRIARTTHRNTYGHSLRILYKTAVAIACDGCTLKR